jgi:Ca2+-dependent lipid-binding protein
VTPYDTDCFLQMAKRTSQKASQKATTKKRTATKKTATKKTTKKSARTASPSRSPSPTPPRASSPSPSPENTTTSYPSVQWVADQHKLVWKLIAALQQNDRLRRGVWKEKGERVTGDTKVLCLSHLCQVVLVVINVCRQLILTHQC